MIIINYPITIHQFLYGLDVNVNIFESNFSYNKWIPNKDGTLIYIKNHNISIRFIIDYIHDPNKGKSFIKFIKNFL